MNEFKLKTRIFTGKGALEQLKTLSLGRVFVVCDPFMERSGMLELVTAQFTEVGAPYAVFARVVPDPTTAVVSAGVAEITAFQPDTVLALGGGSAIDTAKAIRRVYAELVHRRDLCCIAVPTTSGTGTEVTSFAVITDPSEQKKYPLSEDVLLPDVAVLDPVLTRSVPASITADTGVDALVHALEAYASPHANDFTDALCEKAIRLIFDWLPAAVADGADELARTHLHNASCLAGMAFNNASLGLCHGMAHALGGVFHLPHGRSNALVLPLVLRFNAQDTRTALRYAQLAAVLGFAPAGTVTAAAALRRRVLRLLRTVKEPSLLSDCGISPTAFAQALALLARNAAEDACTAGNPRAADEEAIRALFTQLI